MSSPIRAAAQKYIARGWQVVPLLPGSKACKDNDWNRLVFQPEDFRDGDNIGIRSVDGLVDVDLDAAEVVSCAARFLPSTGAVYGRPAKPRAHWLYRSKFEKPSALKDLVTGTTLIEIRIDHQSMAPPSIHPDGQQLDWEEPFTGETAVEPAALLRAVRLIATAAMVARYYNPPGNRHEWGVALAGTLRIIELTEDEASAVVSAAAEWARDDKVKDRLDAVRTTYAKPDDDPLKGTKALEEAIGENGPKFMQSLRKIWGIEAISDSKIERLNERHAVVFQQSGQLVVITEDTDRHGHKFLRYSRLADIRDLYPEQVITGYTPRNTPIYKKLGQAWLESPKRRAYNGIELQPNPKDATPGFYNLWQGFIVEPKKGDWSLFRQHIEQVITGGVDEYSEYVLSWMANTVQHPGRPGDTALAFRGGQGVGKSTFVKWFGSLFGAHFLHLDSARQLTGNFNAHLHNAIVVFADEAAWAGDKTSVGALRRMVTEETLAIERKGMDILTSRNMIHLMLASNENWVVPAALDERRFAVFDVSNVRRNDREYFKSIEQQLFSGGGLAAMLHDLLEWKININLRAIPRTSALIDQKQHSMNAKMKWWHEELLNDDLWKIPHEVQGEFLIDRKLIYASMMKMMLEAGEKEHAFISEMGKFLPQVLPTPYPKDARLTRGGERRRYWIIPSRAKCRAHWVKTTGIKLDHDEDDDESGELF